jgi:hypothetical protein
MSKKRSYILLLIILVSSILAGFYFIRPYSRFLLTVLPPSDLYENIIKEPITIKRKAILKELDLKHNYVGTYFVGILIKEPPVYSKPIVSNAKLKISITHDGKTIYEMLLNRWSNRFGGPGKKKSGIILGSYKVPEDIPLGLHTKAAISIVSPDPLFEHSYGGIDFFIRRSVDQ